MLKRFPLYKGKGSSATVTIHSSPRSLTFSYCCTELDVKFLDIINNDKRLLLIVINKIRI